MCPPEPVLFIYYEENETILIVASTDDFLCTCSNDEIFACLHTRIDRFVPVTIQEGQVMNYINMRVIQTNKEISIDQTHHIKTTILDHWFPPNQSEQLKTVDIPYRID